MVVCTFRETIGGGAKDHQVCGERPGAHQVGVVISVTLSALGGRILQKVRFDGREMRRGVFVVITAPFDRWEIQGVFIKQGSGLIHRRDIERSLVRSFNAAFATEV
jgi:hypothetical protein